MLLALTPSAQTSSNRTLLVKARFRRLRRIRSADENSDLRRCPLFRRCQAKRTSNAGVRCRRHTKDGTAAKDDWAPQGVGCPGACGLVLCQPPRSPTQPHGSAPVTPLGGYEPPPIDFAWLCPAGNTRFVDAKLISSQTAGGCWVR